MNTHVDVIQRNAIESWTKLGKDITVILVGAEEGLGEVAEELGVLHVKEVRTNVQGTPYIPDLFKIARENSDSPLLAFVNADVILLPDFVENAVQVSNHEGQFLLVGQRYDVEINERLVFDDDWDKSLRQRALETGRLHGPSGSDYFIFPRYCFIEVPELVIGRAGWDNWMIYEARQRGWKTIDGTRAITVLHQNHDYSHLPGGKIHFRLPESSENVQAAGGFLHIFPLTDANWQIKQGEVVRRPLSWRSFWREIEIFPLTALHSESLAKIFFYIAHPKRGWLALIGWIQRLFSRKLS